MKNIFANPLGVVGASQDIYANQIRMAVTISDITLIFGTAANLPTGPGPAQTFIEDKATVHLAPITAKMLLENLTAIVRAYETVLGKIPVPANLLTQMKNHSDHLAKTLQEQMNGPGDKQEDPS